MSKYKIAGLIIAGVVGGVLGFHYGLIGILMALPTGLAIGFVREKIEEKYGAE